MEKGYLYPKADKLQRIADYFGVSLEYLLGRSTSRQSVRPEQEEIGEMYLSLAREAQRSGLDLRICAWCLQTVQQLRRRDHK
jgi:transcriptional regulator with XRE-family HTH domain